MTRQDELDRLELQHAMQRLAAIEDDLRAIRRDVAELQGRRDIEAAAAGGRDEGANDEPV